jgi:DNA segregation ATPase FtsK/SpoIIIE, S-DNA-T family
LGFFEDLVGGVRPSWREGTSVRRRDRVVKSESIWHRGVQEPAACQHCKEEAVAASKGTAGKTARASRKTAATRKPAAAKKKAAPKKGKSVMKAAKATTRVKRGGAVMARPEPSTNRTGVHTLRRRRAALAGELGALVAVAAGVLLLLALLSYHPGDKLVGQWGGDGGVHNWVGPFGAWASELAVAALGLTAFAMPLHLGLLAVSIFTRRGGRVRLGEGLGLLGVVSATALVVELVVPTLTFRGGVLHGGGGLGEVLLTVVSSQLGRPGAWVVGLTLLAGSMRVAFGVRVLSLLRGLFGTGGGLAVGAAGASARGARGVAGGAAAGLDRFRHSVSEGIEDWRSEREARREERRWQREERQMALEDDRQAALEEDRLAGLEDDRLRALEDDRLAALEDDRLALVDDDRARGAAPPKRRDDGISAPGRTLIPEAVVELEPTHAGLEEARSRPAIRRPKTERAVLSSRLAFTAPAPEPEPEAPASDPASRANALAKLEALTGVVAAPITPDSPDDLPRVDSMRGATARGVVHAEIRVKRSPKDAQAPPPAAPPKSVRAKAARSTQPKTSGPVATPLPSAAPASSEPEAPASTSRPRINRVQAADVAIPNIDRVVSARRMLAQTKPFELPSLSLLSPPPENATQVDEEELQRQAVRLEQTLLTYGVKGRVTDILPGPVVTMFEFEPAPGIKVSKIANLGDDLAMALRAVKVRIVAPIPGKGAVGIEIPSPERETVYFREVLSSKVFAKVKDKPLPLALGKGVDASPVVANMAKFPHILIAGTTGSGKSVCVNTIIMSLLYTRTPDEVRLILVDPKMLEFSCYDGIPHLLVPVVTSPKKAAMALNWAVSEMTRRYKVLAAMGTRNILGYNEKAEQLRLEWDAYDAAIRAGKLAEKPDCGRALGEDTVVFRSRGDVPHGPPEKMPFIVIIIDELADLMMVARKDVEESIVRLAQMARACGIHMLLATQRPSVDVITGLIKANFPARLSFRVSSKVDSRTVLDANGAESLLGMGDGLFLPPGTSDVVRVHGAFIDDDEVQRVVDHLKTQGEPKYVEAILTEPVDEGGDGGSSEPMDEMYDQCVAVVSEAGKASTSLLQRRLKLGYNRAARIMDAMEREGVIGPQDGARPREVYAKPFDF